MEWRDLNKKFFDLKSKYFPPVNPKTKNTQDAVSFKVSSKADSQVEFDTKVAVKDQKTTEAEFNVKEQLPVDGLKLELKLKNKPAAEVALKFSDKLLPVKGAKFSIKGAATGKDDQRVWVGAGYKNDVVNGNLAFSLPVSQKLVGFLSDPTGDENPLADQRYKVALDAVVKPLDGPYFAGVAAKFDVPREGESFYYDVSCTAVKQTDDFIAGLHFVSKNKEDKKSGEDKQTSLVGVHAYSEVDDLAVGGYAGYGFQQAAYGGIYAGVAASVKRSDKSKFSSKLTIVPDTALAFGFQQAVSSNVDLSFGYSFLLAKESEGEKTKSSAFSVGVEFKN